MSVCVFVYVHVMYAHYEHPQFNFCSIFFLCIRVPGSRFRTTTVKNIREKREFSISLFVLVIHFFSLFSSGIYILHRDSALFLRTFLHARTRSPIAILRLALMFCVKCLFVAYWVQLMVCLLCEMHNCSLHFLFLFSLC